MKLLLVGLDGGDYFTLCKFIERLPYLRAVQDAGAFGRLESWAFPTTASAWPSVYSGCTPEEHGISGFRKDGIAPIRRKPFWDVLDCRIGLMNLPLVARRPDEKFSGFIVPGYSAPRNEVHPPWLQLGKYVIDTTYHQRGRARWLLRGPKRLKKRVKEAQVEFLAFNREVEKRRVDKAIELAKRFEVDLLFVGIMLLDRIGHAFAHHEATMFDTWKTADNLVGRLVAELRPDNVLLFSDHGMAPADSKRIPDTVLENEAVALRKNPNKLNPKGLHTLDGILLVQGTDVEVVGARLNDIAPTIFAMFGQPVPEWMSGRVLNMTQDDVFSTWEQEQLEVSLRALGYI